jgi:hypothetical protein
MVETEENARKNTKVRRRNCLKTIGTRPEIKITSIT